MNPNLTIDPILRKGICANRNPNEPNPWQPRIPHHNSVEAGRDWIIRRQIEARELCAPCPRPVKQACARLGLTVENPTGVTWGGVFIPIGTGRADATHRLIAVAEGRTPPEPENILREPMPGRIPTRPNACIDCDSPMVSNRHRGERPPGHKRHGGKGRCVGCVTAHRRAQGTL